ncbi:MAG: hypothetical protein HY318_06395 [Armatimonadetes bacterium]|nr:hypothetical protein [Armatimonadota bacterium]
MNHTEDQCAQHRKALTAVAVVGLITFLATLLLAPDRAWGSLLLGNFFALTLALGGGAFVAMNYVFRSGWAVAFRRVPEAMTAYLPFGALLMLVTLLGKSQLYPWTHLDVVLADPHMQHKAPYLNLPFFFVRMVIAFAVWIGFTQAICRHSQQQDKDGDLDHTRRNQVLSAVFLILFAITFIFASFDWVMSLQPKWFSTIFPGYMFAGSLLGGTAVMIILTSQLKQRGLLTSVTDHHLYEMSRLLAGVSTFWAYMWFCQYILTYYTNIPEEAVFFTHWRTGSFALLFPLNLVLNWVIPMLMLVSVRSRRDPQALTKISAVVVVGRWVDLYQNIIPAVVKPLRLGLPEVVIFVACLALFALTFNHAFRKAGPTPTHDPYLTESLHMHVS